MKTNKIKIIILLLAIIISYIFYEMTSISSKIVNRDLITISLNNIRNPQIKKIMRYLDNHYASLLFFTSKNAKAYHVNDDDRDKLPNLKIIKKTNVFSKNLYPIKNNGLNWHRNHANSASNRFSKLKLINKKNIDDLSVAWKYEIDKESNYDIQSNVIVAKDKIFIPSYNKKIICLDAKTGIFLWDFKLKDSAPRRGMVFFDDGISNKSKIIFPSYKKLISLNVNDGKINKNFGKNGIVNLSYPSITAPAIFDDNLIITTSEPSINIYNVNSGKFLWKYILTEKQLNKRNGGKRYDYSGGNPWGGFSLDTERGIAFVTTGNAGRYFNGVNRPGINKHANSVIAIDLKKRKKIWDFQEVRHDIWNLDIPAPPILGSITKDDKKIDIVILVTKLGNTIVLDRVSGKTIFDFHLKKAPRSSIPGEKTNYYQPFLKKPEPFAKQFFNLNEVTNINEKSKNYILNKIKNYNYGFFEPYKLGEKNVQFNFHGGAEWSGGSYDLNTETLYVTASNIAWETEVTLNKKKGKFFPKPYYKYNSNFKRLKDQNGYPGSKPPWGSLTSLNLNSGKIIWQVPFGEYSELKKIGVPKTGTLNMGGATATAGNLVFATGTMDKKVRAFNSINGNEVWSYNLPFIGSGPPTIFSINDEQYILIVATGSLSINKSFQDQYKFGNFLYSFKLKK